MDPKTEAARRRRQLALPTSFEPGSPEKVDLLRDRFAYGVELFIDGDTISEYVGEMWRDMLAPQVIWD